MSGIPIHPQPSIYETTVATGPNGTIVHTEVERIMARPKWDFEEANLRLFKERKAREATAQKVAAKRDRTKNTPTRKRRTSKPPQQEKP